jgi:hypothetical protein
MPNESLYSLAHKARKSPNPKSMPPDSMRGVTDPATLLKSDTQRIDRNVGTPDLMWQKSPTTGFSSDIAGREIKKI